MPPKSFELELDSAHEDAIRQATDALAAEGFGVLSRIDVHEKFRDKLGVEFRPYTILGACNPSLARLALDADPEIGLLLPCNVTVEQMGARARVRIIDVAWMLDTAGYAADDEIATVAREADQSLRRVAEALGA